MVKPLIAALILSLSDSGLIKGIVSGLNQIKFPYAYLPVTIKPIKMVAPNFDRFCLLWLWKLKLMEAEEINLIQALCKPGMAVLDLGANIGFHTLNLAIAAGQTGHVWAFEPDQKNFQGLRANLELNRIENVTAVNSAVGEAAETKLLYLSRSNSGNHSLDHPPAGGDPCAATPVNVVTLDDYFQSGPKIDFIKMDIQGYEGLALQGMRTLLQKNESLVILFEFWAKGLRAAGSDPRAVLESLCEMGFRLTEIGSKEKKAITDTRAFLASLNKDQYVNILAVR